MKIFLFILWFLATTIGFSQTTMSTRNKETYKADSTEYKIQKDGDDTFIVRHNGDTLYLVIENMPEFPGGQSALYKFLGENVKYPPKCQKKGIQGKAYVQFTVDKSGKIMNVKLENKVHKLLKEEALRVVRKMPDWKPGKQRGKFVSVSYRLPINFKLQKRKK